MKLIDVTKTKRPDAVILTGKACSKFKKEFTVFYEYPIEYEPFVCDNADAFIPALLIPAMLYGEALEIAPAVSEVLLRNTDIIQDLYCRWWPEKFKRIQISAASTRSERGHGSFAGSFFSLGVDSFYTLLRTLKLGGVSSGITHMIYMIGIEKPLSVYQDNQERAVLDAINEVSHALGIKTLCGKTNVREVFKTDLDWGMHYHGAGLASVAISLSAGFKNIFIPSTHSYRDIFPWGSTPIADPLWSTENISIIHHGAESSRPEKIKLLTQDALAMKHLRVCYANEGHYKNCGHCDKCVRTMISLQILNALPQARLFPSSLARNFTVRIKDNNDLAFAKENLEFAISSNAPQWLIKRLRTFIRTSEFRFLLQQHSLLILGGTYSACVGMAFWLRCKKLLKKIPYLVSLTRFLKTHFISKCH
jgi:hypothetical protein